MFVSMFMCMGECVLSFVYVCVFECRCVRL